MTDDENFKKKIKKNADLINRCITVISENESKEIESEMQKSETILRRESQAPFLHNSDDEKKDANVATPKSPSLHYSNATHSQLSNVDKIAFMLNANQKPKLKTVKKPKGFVAEQKERIVTSNSNPQKAANNKTKKNTKAKVIASGAEAALNKVTTTNKKNAKSKRMKKTRKKIAV